MNVAFVVHGHIGFDSGAIDLDHAFRDKPFRHATGGDAHPGKSLREPLVPGEMLNG